LPQTLLLSGLDVPHSEHIFAIFQCSFRGRGTGGSDGSRF
jgi:hypothetical protein